MEEKEEDQTEEVGKEEQGWRRRWRWRSKGGGGGGEGGAVVAEEGEKEQGWRRRGRRSKGGGGGGEGAKVAEEVEKEEQVGRRGGERGAFVAEEMEQGWRSLQFRLDPSRTSFGDKFLIKWKFLQIYISQLPYSIGST